GEGDQQADQGGGPEGRPEPDAGRLDPGVEQEARSPAGDDGAAEGRRPRHPAPVRQLPGLICRSPGRGAPPLRQGAARRAAWRAITWSTAASAGVTVASAPGSQPSSWARFGASWVVTARAASGAPAAQVVRSATSAAPSASVAVSNTATKHVAPARLTTV